MAFRLKPKNDKAFLLFTENTAIIKQAAENLLLAMKEHENVIKYMQKIDALEDASDVVTRKIFEQLNKSFITPLDREDIYNIAQKLAAIVDDIQGIAERLHLYNTGPCSPAAYQLAELIVKCARQIDKAFDDITSLKKSKDKLIERCDRVAQLESEGDHLYRREVAKLFRECEDPVNLIKWKEILEQMEDALDTFEQLSEMLRGVVVKYA